MKYNKMTIQLKPITLIALILTTIVIQSCSTESESENEYTSITSSTTGSNESHNMGKDCMSCHRPGGGEAPIWRTAGTVYNETLTNTNSNATVKFYTGPDATGTLKYTLSVDAKGNFYTSSAIDFTGGLYPSVTGSTSTNSMSTAITTGSCNSCHDGVSRSRIWTN